MQDPQREANRRRSQMIDIMDSQINSGWIADENSVINPKSLFQTSQGKVIWRREDAKPNAIERIQPANIPQGAFELQKTFDADINHIAGVNDAAFGQIESAHETGVLMQLKQGAAMTNLQEVFDNLRYTQKNLTRKIIKLMQKWSPEKLQKILGEEPAEGFFDPDLTKYDVAIEEGVLTSTQKQMYFAQLVELQQLGVPVSPSDLAKAAPIQGGSKFLQNLEAQEKQAQEQQKKVEEIQMAKFHSEMELDKTKSITNLAHAKERFTRAVANMGLEDERASEAVHNRAQAVLDKARAAKELETMDDDRLLKLLDLFNSIEEINRREEEQIKQDDVNISAHVSNDLEGGPDA